MLSEFADERIREYDIRTQGAASPAGALSGGNQQKVVIAREMSRELKLLVAAQPTRGVDVGSIEFIHKRIIETRDAGIPVVVVSTELDEVVALADRIAVMYRGHDRRDRAGRHAEGDARPHDGRREARRGGSVNDDTSGRTPGTGEPTKGLPPTSCPRSPGR